MVPEKRAKWPSHLGPILIAYNATRLLITGYSPYFLMFGRRPRLPVDLLFPTVRRDENSRTTDEYVTSLYDKLKLALASARDTALLEAQRQKRLYNCRAGAVELHPRDKVLVKLDAFKRSMAEIEKTGGEIPSIRWLNAWRMGYQRMRSRMTRTRKDKCSTGHDCFFGSPNRKASHSGLTAYRSNLVSLEQNWRHHSVGVLNWAWYHAS